MRTRRFTRIATAALALAAVAVTSTIVAAPAAALTTATINFNQSLGERSPYVFGGAINVLESPTDIDSLRSVGVNFVRREALLVDIVPNTTVAQYLTAMGGPGTADDVGVANPANWDWSQYGWVDMYASKGMALMMAIDYNTPWLSYSGEREGIPKDWGIYRDIVGKIYAHWGSPTIDYVEIWNEPDIGFLSLAGQSFYTTNEHAYHAIYTHAALGVRDYSATVPIGGPTTSQPHISWAQNLLTDPNTAPNLNFLSYHAYQENPNGENEVSAWRDMAALHGKPNMPIFVSEWNWNAACAQCPVGLPMNNEATDAIAYNAQRLDNFIRQNAAGTGHYAMNKLPRDPGFYAVNADGSLTPKMSAYRVMSKQLALGDGTFDLKGSSWVNGSALVIAGGATNSVGTNVAWVINVATAGDTLALTLNGLKPGMQYSAAVYEASAGNNGSAVRETITFTTNSAGTGSATLGIPAKSVLGLKLTEADVRPDLAATGTATADSNFGGAYVASKVNDGNGFTRWASAATTGTHWIQVDLGSSKPLNEVAVNWETAYGANYTVETSNGAGWTVQATVAGNTTAGLKTYRFPTVTARYVRINVTAAAWGNLVSAYSLSVYHDLARGKTVSTDSVYDGTGTYAPAKAVDGDDATRFASGIAGVPHWMVVDLGSSQSVRTVRVNWEAAYGVNYTVQTSPDGVNWTTRSTITGNAGPGWRVSNFTAVTARYVRVHVTQAAFGALISAYTVNVY